MDKPKTVREILNIVYIEGRSRKSFKKGNEIKDQALSQIKEELLGKLPKEKEDYDCLSDITHADKELAETQAIAMRIGFNSCLSQVKKIISEV